MIEVELIEPSLFLELLGDEAADRFAALLYGLISLGLGRTGGEEEMELQEQAA